MEKMKLARNTCKSLYGLGFRKINDRVLKHTEESSALLADYSKATADPEFRNKLLAPKEAVRLRNVKQVFEQSHANLINSYEQFKLHEEPNILKFLKFKLFRTYLAPFTATTLAGVFLLANAFERQLKEEDQALEMELSKVKLDG